ncbi:hypothetical protein FHS72_002630 [Loktanella ponticola]|uniref:Uncharacterized protein n=1 Tax=Yoonia ponticola TaxID=1524255 RepID=A0A7W9EYS1_9RHOB|nr:hypothetical protein [Yoonia ponticola]MBB5722994.1 hypothetical protein [Yoonia ponticola]
MSDFKVTANNMKLAKIRAKELRPDLAKFENVSAEEEGMKAGGFALIPILLLMFFPDSHVGNSAGIVVLIVAAARWAYIKKQQRKLFEIEMRELDVLESIKTI